MRTLPLIAFAVLLSAPAFAQDSLPTNTIMVQSQPAPPPRSQISAPSSAGLPLHVCGRSFYPAAAIRAGATGTATLGFSIKTDGTIEDVKIVKSTGNVDLDQASLTCSRGWRYKPAMRDGQPIEVPWKVSIAWNLWDDSNFARRLSGESYACLEPHSDPGRAGTPLPARVKTDVDAGGNVTNVTLLLSSGDTAFDKYVTTCASHWHFAPASGNATVSRMAFTLVTWLGAPAAPDTLPKPDGEDTACGKLTRTGYNMRPGYTRLEFTVEIDGSLSNIRVMDSSGDADFDAYAVACAAKWKYSPAMRDGRLSPVVWRTGVARATW